MLDRVKWIGTALIMALVITIVVQNWQQTTTTILFTEVTMPRALLLFGTFAVGHLSGMVFGNPLRRLRRKRAKSEG